MCDRAKFEGFLHHQYEHYRELLEGMFGRFDTRFVFGSFKRSSSTADTPQLAFRCPYHRNGGCVVDIHTSSEPWDHCWWNQAAWQVAHETVHLIDPVEYGKANVLEEGLATWFQLERSFHCQLVQDYIDRGFAPNAKYAEAKALVRACMPDLVPAVKQLRDSGVRISDITADLLRRQLDVEGTTLEQLCRKFQY